MAGAGTGRGARDDGHDERRVFVVDDHEMVREGLRRLIDAQDGFRVVGDAGTHADALARIRATRPDLVVLDLHLPDADGLDTCREIVARTPHVKVLVLTASSDLERRRATVRAGAAGYVVKALRRQQIVDALRRVATGELAFGADELDDPAADVPGDATGSARSVDEARVAALTTDERTILRLIVDGLTNHAIAAQLGVSEKSVKKQVSSIFTSLGVTSRVGAAVVAARYADWLQLPGPPS
jgi:two-component system, NarL family, response regulator DevR